MGPLFLTPRVAMAFFMTEGLQLLSFVVVQYFSDSPPFVHEVLDKHAVLIGIDFSAAHGVFR